MTGGRPTRWFSSQQEKTVAKAVGGNQVSNSGATLFRKGDVVTSKVLLECKTRTKPQTSFTVKREWIEKNKEEAFAMGKDYSAVVIDFGDGEQHYIIGQKMFDILLETINREC